MIRAFLHLSNSNNFVVNKTRFKRLCSDNAYPQYHVVQFEAHFASIKTDAGNSHGKVFIEDNFGNVRIYPEVMIQIKRFY